MSVVQIVGAGPGAEDLITVRGMHALEQADFVLYAGSLVNPALLAYCKETCVIKDSSSMNLEEQIEQMLFYAKQGKNVVRLHAHAGKRKSRNLCQNGCNACFFLEYRQN